MTSQLDGLKRHSVIVADTGDIESIARFKPQDATTNPSLIFKAAQDARYRPIIDEAIAASAVGVDANARLGEVIEGCAGAGAWACRCPSSNVARGPWKPAPPWPGAGGSGRWAGP